MLQGVYDKKRVVREEEQRRVKHIKLPDFSLERQEVNIQSLISTQ